MEEVVQDHRQATRAEVSLVAKVRPVKSTVYVAGNIAALGVAIMDISTLGLSFLTDRPFDTDDLVEVELSWGGSELYLHGIVRHVDARGRVGGLNNVGIQYIVTPSTKHAIETLRRWLQTAADTHADIGGGWMRDRLSP